MQTTTWMVFCFCLHVSLVGAAEVLEQAPPGSRADCAGGSCTAPWPENLAVDNEAALTLLQRQAVPLGEALPVGPEAPPGSPADCAEGSCKALWSEDLADSNEGTLTLLQREAMHLGETLPADPKAAALKPSVEPAADSRPAAAPPPQRLAFAERPEEERWWPFGDGEENHEMGETQPDHYTAKEEELEFELLAEAVYDFDKPLPMCWTRQLNFTFTDDVFGGTDNVGIYHCQCARCMEPESKDSESSDYDQGGGEPTSCALLFSGSNDLLDWIHNLQNMAHGNFCGYTRYAAGWANSALRLLSHSAWQPIHGELQRCTRLVVIGHSLGGALANMFAHCMNCSPGRELQGEDGTSAGGCYKPRGLRGIRAEAELHTFGAPAVLDGVVPLNDRAHDGVFRGKRFWNYDCHDMYGGLLKGFAATECNRFEDKWVEYDPVPTVAQSLGYKHPKMESVGLDKHYDLAAMFNATLPETPDEPGANGYVHWDISEHFLESYHERVLSHLFRAGR